MLQDQLRQAQESVSTMRKLHEFAQSQLFELRAQSGQNAFKIFVFISYICIHMVFNYVNRTNIHISTLFNSTVCLIIEEERAGKQSEVMLLMDEVEQAQTRLLSLEREKVTCNSYVVFEWDPLDLSKFQMRMKLIDSSSSICQQGLLRSQLESANEESDHKKRFVLGIMDA